jgi:hypothetical protein
MSYRIAGIDVHKRVLAVVVTAVEIESEYQFERRMFGSNPEQLRSLAAWLLEQEAEELCRTVPAVRETWCRQLVHCQRLSFANSRRAGSRIAGTRNHAASGRRPNTAGKLLLSQTSIGTRARFWETAGEALPYTTASGMLKQPDKRGVV